MKEKGIIMSGNHPKLILDGIKTQTRRVIKPQPHIERGVMRWQKPHKGGMHGIDLNMDDHADLAIMFCPYGKVGDRLWVRETWAADKLYDSLKPRDIPDISRVCYFRGGIGEGWDWVGKTRSSMFLPHRFSNLTLEITEVRVERVQEITEADAKAEGCIAGAGTAKYSFMILWDSLNAKRGYGWEVNPFVWVIDWPKYSTENT